MTSASPPPQKFRLTASNVARYFGNRGDRYFRWNTVATPLRGKPGIGRHVPRKGHSEGDAVRLNVRWRGFSE